MNLNSIHPSTEIKDCLSLSNEDVLKIEMIKKASPGDCSSDNITIAFC